MDYFGSPYDHGWIEKKGKFLRYNPKGELNHDEVAQHFGKNGEDDALDSGWVRFSASAYNKDYALPGLGDTSKSNELYLQMHLPSIPPLAVVTKAMKEWPYGHVYHLDIWDGWKMQSKSFGNSREAIGWINGLRHNMKETKLLGFRQWLTEMAIAKWWYNHDDQKLYKITGSLHHLQWAYRNGDKLHLSPKQRLDVAQASNKGRMVSDVTPSSLENNSRILLQTSTNHAGRLYITQGEPSSTRFAVAQDVVEKLGVDMDTLVTITNWVVPDDRYSHVRREINVEAEARDVLIARSMQELRKMNINKWSDDED